MVVCSGELDVSTVDTVRKALSERGPGEEVVLDLGRLTFLDTSGIQLVVETHREARDTPFGLRLLRAPHRVHRVFELAGLEGVLPFEGGEQDG